MNEVNRFRELTGRFSCGGGHASCETGFRKLRMLDVDVARQHHPRSAFVLDELEPVPATGFARVHHQAHIAIDLPATRTMRSKKQKAAAATLDDAIAALGSSDPMRKKSAETAKETSESRESGTVRGWLC